MARYTKPHKSVIQESRKQNFMVSEQIHVIICFPGNIKIYNLTSCELRHLSAGCMYIACEVLIEKDPTLLSQGNNKKIFG